MVGCIMIDRLSIYGTILEKTIGKSDSGRGQECW